MLRMVDVIEKKRNGHSLTKEEIEFFVTGYTTGDVPDYQASALLMTIYFQGMNAEEQSYLTMAMARSGEQIDLSKIAGIKVDKHSSGGVGDTATIVLAPLVAACGVPIAKMSGRGLGHTGGTLDKLEAVQGLSIELTKEAFIQQVNDIKIAIMGQSENLTPADQRLYELRDVTATVDSIPLIASSIMSKKIAAGADAIVLDVKVGSGAFMKTVEEAKELAHNMVAIGTQVGRTTLAIISNMNEPLGYAIGNALELEEAIETLRGNGPADLTELCYVLGSQMVVAGGKAETLDEARLMLEGVVADGSALQLFGKFIQAQGGNEQIIYNTSSLPKARYKIPVPALATGYIGSMEANAIGVVAMKLGAGRAKKEDTIDLAVGIVLQKKTGDKVTTGEPLAILHTNSEDVVEAIKKMQASIHIVGMPVEKPVLIKEVIFD